jgi:hypothetical protein
MKSPVPLMPPMTMRVASNAPSLRAKPAARAATYGITRTEPMRRLLGSALPNGATSLGNVRMLVSSEQLWEFPAKMREFWFVVDKNVRVERVVCHEVLVVILSGVKPLQRRNFRYDRRMKHMVPLELRDILRSGELLRVIRIENLGAVLRSLVRPLAVELSRIVRHEKIHLHQVSERDFCRIVRNVDRFSVSRRSAAYRFVMRCRGTASGVSGDNFSDAAQLLKNRLHSPEASSGQHDMLKRQKD